MGMSFWRWGASVTAACVAVAFMVLPFPPVAPRAWESTDPAPVLKEFGKLSEDAARAHVAVREYRATQALDRWSATPNRRDTTLIRIDPSVPPNVAATVRSIVAEQWASLGIAPSAAHAEVFVYLDSTAIKRAGDTLTSRRVLEARRFVDVVFALPPATDGNRCVALVRLRGSTSAHLNALRSQSLIGTCGFFAAFGNPGAGMAQWLAAARFRLARQSDWTVARPPATDESSIYSLSRPAGECLTGSSSRCDDALLTNAAAGQLVGLPARRLAWVLDPGTSWDVPSVRREPITLGSADGQFMADVARSLGPERFKTFWQGAGSPTVAFRAAAGMELSQWTQQWLTRTYGAVEARPRVRVRDVFWLVIAAPLVLVVAARPRQVVLNRQR